MKKALTIAVISIGLMVLGGCGVEVKDTASSAEPKPEPIELTVQEQKIYDYIARTYPSVEDLWVRMEQAVEDESIEDLMDCCSEFIVYAKSWNKLDWTNGQVTTLEFAFAQYMDGNRRYYKNWLNGTLGDGDIDQCAANAIKAQATVEKWGPRVAERLDRISQ